MYEKLAIELAIRLAPVIATYVLEHPEILEHIPLTTLLPHILEHEAVGSAKVIDKARAENPDIPCHCFSYEDETYCWKPGYLGLISSKKNPEQIENCVIKTPAGEGVAKRFREMKGAIGEAHQEWEKEGGDLKQWWGKVGEKLSEKGILL